jgi:hypothetical protein
MSSQVHPFALPPPSPIYRRFFTREEIRDLDASAMRGAMSEISILRILMARILEDVRRRTRLDLESRFGILIAFCHAAATIASLARLEARRRGPLPDPLLESLAVADEAEL